MEYALILIENYSPGELEERLELTLGELESGIEDYVENNYENVERMLKEDLYV